MQYASEHSVHREVLNLVARHVFDQAALLSEHCTSRNQRIPTLRSQTRDLQDLPRSRRLVHVTRTLCGPQRQSEKEWEGRESRLFRRFWEYHQSVLQGRLSNTHGFSCEGYDPELGEIEKRRRSRRRALLFLQNPEDRPRMPFRLSF